jgi:hypothetical protein
LVIVATALDGWAPWAGGWAGRSLLPSRRDPLGLGVPADEQVAYFETYMTAFFFTPLTTSELGTVLGPFERLGVRTPEWKLLTDHLIGACSRGTAAQRDDLGVWTLRDPVALDAERCRQIRTAELYRESDPSGRLELSATEPPEVLAALREAVETHSARRPLATDGGHFTLSPEQERKLKSLGYLR